jgi:Domain of unknown function (DUF1843)
MPTRKTIKATTVKSKVPALEKPIRPLYGIPIWDTIKRGNAAEMKKMAAQARKHVKEVQTALDALEKKIAGS